MAINMNNKMENNKILYNIPKDLLDLVTEFNSITISKTKEKNNINNFVNTAYKKYKIQKNNRYKSYELLYAVARYIKKNISIDAFNKLYNELHNNMKKKYDIYTQIIDILNISSSGFPFEKEVSDKLTKILDNNYKIYTGIYLYLESDDDNIINERRKYETDIIIIHYNKKDNTVNKVIIIEVKLSSRNIDRAIVQVNKRIELFKKLNSKNNKILIAEKALNGGLNNDKFNIGKIIVNQQFNNIKGLIIVNTITKGVIENAWDLIPSQLFHLKLCILFNKQKCGKYTTEKTVKKIINKYNELLQNSAIPILAFSDTNKNMIT